MILDLQARAHVFDEEAKKGIREINAQLQSQRVAKETLDVFRGDPLVFFEYRPRFTDSELELTLSDDGTLFEFRVDRRNKCG